ncbi:PKD domain-containing protein, partial [Escherichia coli]|nr:PKD domain-containing protein [Escherichia coli]
LDYTWSVNGEEKANGESFSHAFSEAGTYQVSLKVTDPQGASGTKTASVSVEADTAPEPESEVEFVASAANSGTANATTHSVK